MLSRTADGLFWLARYMERAENVARILTAGQRIASLSRSVGSESNEWASTLVAAGCAESYREKHGEMTPGGVVDFLVRDPSNPSSVLSCLETARRNARAVRTALTADMWESLNDTWLELRSFESFEGASAERIARLLEWVKGRSLLFSGAYANTMLRNDAYYFTQLGTFLERADNTARILDVKYHVLLPKSERVGGALDYCQWESILRAVSALRAYHWVYHARLAPWMIAELLILRPEMPRSLCACYAQITRHLDLLTEAYGGRRGECHRRAGEIHARLRYGRIDAIMQSGLHEFLTEIVDDTIALGRDVGEFYLLN
ncbi:MAG TPA: alpha-E domain-containing protein [Myxococcota bacterium]|nr:alpha-E domain-containing protein [Myxococcota bacterium]